MISKKSSLKSKKISPVVARINRVEGQVRGVRKMYELNPCDCVSLVTQVQAARSALGKIAEVILADEAERCVDERDMERLEKVVKTTFKSI